MKYAGTQDEVAAKMLMSIFDDCYDIEQNEGAMKFVNRNQLNETFCFIALSTSLIMAGSCSREITGLIMKCIELSEKPKPSYKISFISHMALGYLYMSTGRYF